MYVESKNRPFEGAILVAVPPLFACGVIPQTLGELLTVLSRHNLMTDYNAHHSPAQLPGHVRGISLFVCSQHKGRLSEEKLNQYSSVRRICYIFYRNRLR